MRSTYLTFTVLLLCLGLAFPLSVFAQAGKAKMVIGQAIVVTKDGVKKRLKRGSLVNTGDTIMTNNRAQVQLVMDDGSVVSVRPSTEFLIEDYVHTGNAESDKTHYQLIKGAFRSVTGSIGKKNKSSFQLATPVATLGIRGTDFVGKYCAQDCPAGVNDGLFVDVVNGGVSMTNDAGTFDLDKDTNGYVADANQSPGAIDKLPDNLLSPKNKKTDSSNTTGNNNRYPSPDEEMIQISMTIAPDMKNEIIQEAMAANVAPANIIRGADSAGIEPQQVLPDMINEGKKRGMEPSQFVKPILESGVQAEPLIKDLMVSNPQSAGDILTAAIATGEMNNDVLKQAALSAGVSPTDVDSADTVGNLFALPPEVKKLLEEDKASGTDTDTSVDTESSSNPTPRELTPTSDSSDVASPS